MVKKGLRTLGIDDGKIISSESSVSIFGIFYRGSEEIQKVVETKIEKDGLNATEKILEIIRTDSSDHLKAVFLDGITFGGLNLADIEKIWKESSVPAIAVNRKKPSKKEVKKACKQQTETSKREKIIDNAGELVNIKGLWLQYKGLEKQKTKEIIEKTRRWAKIPEPLRTAHLIASREKIDCKEDSK